MPAETISFHCPACSVQLTVPTNLAGVAGPCPTCHAPIVAPTRETNQPPAQVRPEPRQLPMRQTPNEPLAAKPMPEPQSATRGDRIRRSGRGRTIQVLMPVVFLTGALAIAVTVILLLRNHGKPVPAETRSPSESAEVAILPTWSEPSTPSDLATDAQEPPGEGVMAVLHQFLAASSLEERLPLLETRTVETELEGSCLAGGLPKVAEITLTAVETKPLEQVTDYYHAVNFDLGGGQKDPQTILVRVRGSAGPKVVVDPFLDLFGGRLAAYAESPTEKPRTFHVIAWPLASCFESTVPEPRKKLTLKLLSQEGSGETALAYCGRQSRIAAMLEDGNQSLAYGKSKPCTITLRWNTEENPGMPFLEAVAVNSPDWNP